jgi:GNAT superfamily N-acetyltransferase
MPVTVRALRPSDVEQLQQRFPKKPPGLFAGYLGEHGAGIRHVLVADIDGGGIAGYLTVFLRPDRRYFVDRDIPEVRDFNVIDELRRQGVGSLLMDAAEAFVRPRCDTLGIAVGLHHWYGPAQRMYVLRGFIPLGEGVTYEDRRVEAGETVQVDDALLLRFAKRLG